MFYVYEWYVVESGDIFYVDFVCEYGNQQPSRENSSNSIPEGSTTNG